MPIYTYKCLDEECEHIEDDVLIRSISNEEEERPDCGECGGPMSKVAGQGSYMIHYKGDGFYQTDVNKKNYQ